MDTNFLEQLDEDEEDDAQEKLIPDGSRRENIPKRNRRCMSLPVREVVGRGQDDADKVERQAESEKLEEHSNVNAREYWLVKLTDLAVGVIPHAELRPGADRLCKRRLDTLLEDWDVVFASLQVGGRVDRARNASAFLGVASVASVDRLRARVLLGIEGRRDGGSDRRVRLRVRRHLHRRRAVVASLHVGRSRRRE